MKSIVKYIEKRGSGMAVGLLLRADENVCYATHEENFPHYSFPDLCIAVGDYLPAVHPF